MEPPLYVMRIDLLMRILASGWGGSPGLFNKLALGQAIAWRSGGKSRE
jgi:hypothetical protein